MDKLIIKQANVQETVSSAVIDKLYRYALNSKVEDANNTLLMEVEGMIRPQSAYADAVAYLRQKFPNLTININVDDCYIRFTDPEILSALMSKNIGDGTGITLNLMNTITDARFYFQNNLSISNLEDLLYFTALSVMIDYICSLSDSVLLNTEFARNSGSPTVVKTINKVKFPRTNITIRDASCCIGVDTWGWSVRINNVDWNGATLTPIYKGGSIFRSVIFDWSPSLLPNQTSNIQDGIGVRLFYSCYLPKCIFPEGYLDIYENWQGCAIQYIEYPTTVRNVGNLFQGFRRDASFGTSGGTGCIVIKAVTPPTLGKVETNTNYNKWPAHIYVPDGSVDAYKTAWAELGTDENSNYQTTHDMIVSLITPMSLMTSTELELGTVTQEDINRT